VFQHREGGGGRGRIARTRGNKHKVRVEGGSVEKDAPFVFYSSIDLTGVLAGFAQTMVGKEE
jgi:hypothetical protein